MTRDDAIQIVTMLANPFRREVTDDLVDAWLASALVAVDLFDAIAVAMALLDTADRFPAPAQFNAQRKAMERAEVPALPEPPLPKVAPETAAEHIADMRAMLAKLNGSLNTSNGTRGHWHGGPMPCKVCGGISPDALAALSPADRMKCEMERDQILAEQNRRFSMRH